MSRIDWRKSKHRDLVSSAIVRAETVEIPVDKTFWKVWEDDRQAMKAAGYRLTKIDGKWRAFLTK